MTWSKRFFRRRPEKQPLIFGHRGARLDSQVHGTGRALIENTMPAFEEALRQGADAIELDVRVCASGELVVFHDPDLSRLTQGTDRRSVATLSYDILRQIDLDGHSIPLLSEVLSFARHHHVSANIEMKMDVPNRRRVVIETARLLHRWDSHHAILVSSFDPLMLSGFALLSPDLPRAQLVHRSSYHDPWTYIAPYLGGFAMHIERTIASPKLITALQQRDQVVNVWTVNDPDEARDLARLGVDGLITDMPQRIWEALRR